MPVGQHGSTQCWSAKARESSRSSTGTAARFRWSAFANGALPPPGSHVHDQRRAVQRHGLWIQPDSPASSILDTTARQQRPDTSAARSAPRTCRLRCCRICRFRHMTRQHDRPELRGNPPGGANSDYTAADFQHMLLAAQVANATHRRIQTLPSFHRPALCSTGRTTPTALTTTESADLLEYQHNVPPRLCAREDHAAADWAV